MAGIADCRHQVPSVGSNLQLVRLEDSKRNRFVVSAWRTRIKQNGCGGNDGGRSIHEEYADRGRRENRVASDLDGDENPHGQQSPKQTPQPRPEDL